MLFTFVKHINTQWCRLWWWWRRSWWWGGFLGLSKTMPVRCSLLGLSYTTHYWTLHCAYSALLNMHNLNFHTLFVYGSCSWHCTAITTLMNTLYWTEQVVMHCNAFSHQIHFTIKAHFYTTAYNLTILLTPYIHCTHHWQCAQQRQILPKQVLRRRCKIKIN